MEYERPRTRERVLALDDLSLDVPEASFVSIVGPSGCGKTTLLLIIDGLVTPTAGSVVIGGHEVTQPGPDRAMVFQEASLFPWYTCLRNCAYGLECQGLPRREAETRAASLLGLVGLSGFEKHYPPELSIGMQQRVNLARALAVDPLALLMDEPFAALDAQTREFMQAELLRIWEQTRKTVLFITHQLDEAIYLSDRVVVMSARPGRIIDDVAIELERPRSLDLKRTREFLDYERRLWSGLEAQARHSRDIERDSLREAHRS